MFQVDCLSVDNDEFYRICFPKITIICNTDASVSTVFTRFSRAFSNLN